MTHFFIVKSSRITRAFFVPVLFLSLIVLGGCRNAEKSSPIEKKNIETFQDESPAQVPLVNSSVNQPANFIEASKVVIPAVVHIKTMIEGRAPRGNSFFDQFYGEERGRPIAMASGSGVVISADGYIATNNHVVENAASIEVIFPDKKSFKAKLVGADENTDLALLKVDAKDVPFIKFGNSDEAQIGEWVLAAGYPLSLNSTVTSGIISAKGRSIGIINQAEQSRFGGGESAGGNSAIESFIQTDAAINPGNSGGALVNTKGELIGINTAIASQTGSYAGYAFAVPVNLAKKVLEDLKNFGVVKRGILGVSYPAPSQEDQYLRQQGVDPSKVQGVYIMGIQKGSAADVAGLKPNDIVQSIDGEQLNSSSEFSERIARHRPGDVIILSYRRNGNPATVSVTLQGENKNLQDETDESLAKIYEKLGATFQPLSDEDKQQLRIRSGVVVDAVRSGGFFDRIGVPAGTIIVNINGKPINSPKEIDQILLSGQKGVIKMMAIAPDGSRLMFSFSLGT